MNIFGYLIKHAPQPDSPPPEVTIAGNRFTPTPMDDWPDDDLDDIEDDDLDDDDWLFTTTGATKPDTDAPPRLTLRDLFCVIEYTDARGNTTRRRVTMRSISQGPSAPIIHSVCHERRAYRSFRADRIRAVITEYGELVPLDQFLTGLGYDLTTIGQIQQQAAPNEWQNLLGAALTILVAAARADNDWHMAEIDAIQTFAEREALALRREGATTLPFDASAADRIDRLIHRMRPTGNTVKAALRHVMEWPAARQTRLHRAIEQVIAADGILNPDELEFLNDLSAPP